jgi:hypothetical protein
MTANWKREEVGKKERKEGLIGRGGKGGEGETGSKRRGRRIIGGFDE